MLLTVLSWVHSHPGVVSLGVASAWEFISRKWPGAQPLTQILNDVLDKVPGLKDNTGK